jgi:uncharacterized membrane protein
MRELTKTFLRGLAAILPISLTLYILWWLGSTAEHLLGGLLSFLLPGRTHLPGAGLVLGLAAVFGIGVLLEAGLVRRVWRFFERRIEKLPVVRTVYGPLKDLMGFVAASSEGDRLDTVVMVSVGEPSMDVIGFLTRESGRELTGRVEDEGRVAVYLPMSYQLGGYLVFVPPSRVTRLDMHVDQALRIALTAGMSAGTELD